MKKIFASLFLMLAMSGCMPLQQTNISGGKGYDHFGIYDDYGLLSVGPSNQTKAIQLIDSESYAVGPNAKKYGIKSEPHDFDISQKYPYVRDRIYVMDDGRPLRSLKDGTWKFVFYFMTTGGKDSRTFDAQLGTFYYNPVIHGAPN
jgi:hypothetical protein